MKRMGGLHFTQKSVSLNPPLTGGGEGAKVPQILAKVLNFRKIVKNLVMSFPYPPLTGGGEGAKVPKILAKEC